VQSSPAHEVLLKSALAVAPVEAGAVDSPELLARHLLCEAEQLQRIAAAGDDAAIGDELMGVAGRCSAAAAALLSHAGGHAEKLTSHILDR
jgi:hypothetical protein